jgi:xanthine dehydrogenase accessory factor
VIFGAGHVGAEVAKVAAGAGFHVLLIDDRAEFANGERVLWAHEVQVTDFRAALDRLVLDGDDYLLATTRGHSHDAYIIERTAASPARYVGMLGSRRKREVIWKALEEAGVPRAALERVRVPIGEPIGAETPAEIAVSVVAELIKVRRTGERGRGKGERSTGGDG